MASIDELKNKRKSYQEIADQMSDNKNQYQDDRLWYPERDNETGNASALIRFLPEPPGEDMPWVKVFHHFFKSDKTGKWFVKNCPTTIGQQCPVCTANSELWNNGGDEGKQLARNRKRKISYYSNILVKEDKANPENEGKVFLFKYGQQIFDILQLAINPEFDEETPVNVFDAWEGADLRFRIRKVEGQVNYQKSEFLNASAIGTDDEIEEIWKQAHSLSAFVESDQFESYEALEDKFKDVIGEKSQTPRQTSEKDSKQDNSEPESKSAESEEKTPSANDSNDDDDDDDDVMDEIQNLLND